MIEKSKREKWLEGEAAFRKFIEARREEMRPKREAFKADIEALAAKIPTTPDGTAKTEMAHLVVLGRKEISEWDAPPRLVTLGDWMADNEDKIPDMRPIEPAKDQK